MKKLVSYLKVLCLMALCMVGAKTMKAQCTVPFINVIDLPLEVTYSLSCDGGATWTTAGPYSVSTGGWSAPSTTSITLPPAFCPCDPSCEMSIKIDEPGVAYYVPIPYTISYGVATNGNPQISSYLSCCGGGWSSLTGSGYSFPPCTANTQADVTFDNCGNVTLSKPASCP